MKNLKMILILFFLFLVAVQSNVLAIDVPFEYAIIPMVKSGSPVDTNYVSKLEFDSQFYSGDVYYKGLKLEKTDNHFFIDITNLTGHKEITITNDKNDTKTFDYYFSNKAGKLDDYNLLEGKNLNSYIKTFKNVSIIYTDKEKVAVERLTKYLEQMPENLLVNLKEIKMIPYSNTKNIAGTTKDSSIVLYNFSKYGTTTQKNVIFHEITHTWANKLIDQKVLDYSYTDYSTVVKNDGNYVSKYSKEFTNENGRLSEDFADSVAFHLINKESFKRNYPNRAIYIENLIQNN